MTPLRFTARDADRAYAQWGCNCGPAALAAIAGVTFEAVRPKFAGFEQRGYVNPTMMYDALRQFGVRWRVAKVGDRAGDATCTFLGWPRFGLARVQWEGPWSAPGANPRWAYRHTHWVAAAAAKGDVAIFDVNAIERGWLSSSDWRVQVASWLMRAIRRASGTWHLTHAIEIEQRRAEAA
jgi:hypothetical protein